MLGTWNLGTWNEAGAAKVALFCNTPYIIHVRTKRPETDRAFFGTRNYPSERRGDPRLGVQLTCSLTPVLLVNCMLARIVMCTNPIGR